MRKLLNLMAFISLLFLFSCNETTTQAPKGYDDFAHIEHWDELSDLPDGNIIIYYYSPYCEVCQAMKEEVLEKLDQLEEDYVIYLISEGMIYEQGEPPFETKGVPALFIYNDGDYSEMLLGSKPVLEYLSSKLD
jgi:thiol-disulfide isomerase/thioredoxin